MRSEKEVKVLGIVPARGGSKGIPRKNIIDLAGKPLIAHTIQTAHQASLLDACIVSTDDIEIADVARKFGADVPFLRPAELAQDNSTDIGFMQHAIDWVAEHRQWKPDILVMLQPTSPTRTPDDIDSVIRIMVDKNADSVRTVVDPSPHNPFKMWTFIDDEGRMKPLLPTEYFDTLGTDVPRQKLPKYFLQIGFVYATRVSLLRQGKVIGPRMFGYVIPRERLVDIDSYEDLARAESIMAAHDLNSQTD